MSSFKERLSDMLITKKLATREQLAAVVEDAKGGGKNFSQLLVDRGVITEERLFALLSEDLGIPTISLAKYRLDPVIARLIPERVARHYTVIPLSQFGERIVVAMADPLNIVALDDLKMLTQFAIDPVLAPEVEIHRAIEQVYAGHSPIPVSAAENGGVNGASTDEEVEENLESVVQLLLADQVDEAPVVRVINLMVLEAIRRRASDIHLEPLEESLRIRYRIDGRLVEAHQLPKKVQNAVLTRLKIMSGMDITESRLPQDGRFKALLDTREVDFRVSVLPLIHGGKVVLRALDKGNLSIGLDHLGFLPESIAAFREAVKRPYGMILVTGPTGSGKSTTLYSVLNQLNVPQRNLITIEDPVEYQVEGITQVQVNPDIGLTFASGLRALLRQSPDVVMIGEIRDFETADIAMKASLTGQLVLSTLHTNDAASAITRLIDMGVEPFLVASGVTLIEAQRLIRRLCSKCREPYTPAAEMLQKIELPLSGKHTFFHAKGCHLCNGTGYKGRLGIIEVIMIDDHIRELIVNKAHSWEIKRYAIEQLHMTPLREDGLKKAMNGVTTLEEVLHATAEE